MEYNTSDYLEQLVQDKSDLVTNLTEKGIEGLTGDETFTELVPKVNDIQTGVDLDEYFTDHYTELGYTGQYLWQSSLRKIPPITLPNYFISLSTAFYNMPFTIYAIEFDENFDTSNVTTFYGMFQNSRGLVELDLSVFNTSNVTNMSGMFNGCNLLRKINMSSFDMSKVNNITSMFQSLGSLEEISFGVNLGKGFTSSQSLNLTGSSLITHDSLMSIINNLYDISASGITCYLALGKTNLAKLTSDEIGVATAKGWTVS